MAARGNATAMGLQVLPCGSRHRTGLPGFGSRTRGSRVAPKRKKAKKKLEEPGGSARKRPRGARPEAVKAAAKTGKRSRTWLKRAKNVTDDDVRFVVESGVADADELLESAHSWLVRLAKRVRLLYDMLVAWWTGRFEFPKATVAGITLALLYFINPFDMIPDVLPMIGVVDDALVFAFVAKMMQDDVKRYAKKFGLKASELVM